MSENESYNTRNTPCHILQRDPPRVGGGGGGDFRCKNSNRNARPIFLGLKFSKSYFFGCLKLAPFFFKLRKTYAIFRGSSKFGATW